MATAPVPAEEILATLTTAIQELSLADSPERVQQIVRTAARRLVQADGATFVLRDGDKCFYVDEDAIEPLWKGQRFPLEACISGWAMLNRNHVVIPDIYADDRVPHDAYRPTFVKSLVMVPIRTIAPIGSIGVYWADHHAATDQEIGVLRALADSTAVALESLSTATALDQARELADTDPLTGLANRRAWDRSLTAAVAMGEPFCVAVLDLDRFKRFNDRHGHPAGDALLVTVAAAWTSTLRSRDLLARTGGEEFCLLLPGAGLEDARNVATRMLRVVPDQETVSIGVAAGDRSEPGAAVHARADAALYAAKAAGRDRVHVAG